MDSKALIFDKLEAFIKRFYTNELIKGLLLFIGLGLLYFIFTTVLEYFLWLSTTGRTILFWLFIGVEFYLLLRFILFPLFKLFKIQKGIDYTEASKIIGNHFSEVSDKLTNFLQLNEQSVNSELLQASIDQKANSLSPIPFSNAINFSKNKKYLPYTLIPILLLVLFFVSGNSNIISQGFSRVVNFNTKYNPPAPFSFKIQTNKLEVEQNKSFVLSVETVGSIIPENVSVVFNNETYLMESVKPGFFKFVFENVTQDISFHLESNVISSPNYILKVVDVPTIENFEMVLTYPSHLKKKSEIIKGTGNAFVPEGTSISWKISTASTTQVSYLDDKARYNYEGTNGLFIFSKKFLQNTDYQIITSNAKLSNFEKLAYQITVQKDQFPLISTQASPDSLKIKNKYIIGNVSDDFGLSKLQVVYYPKDTPVNTKRANLAIKNGTVDQFVYSFPIGINLEQGIVYEYYFEVFDNDVVNGFKSSKSSVFSHNELSEEQKEEKLFKDQKDNINSLSKALQNQNKQNKELDNLQKINKEKTNLDYKDQKKIQDFLEKQKEQEQMMKEFSKKLSENLEHFNPKEINKEKEELLIRLEQTQKESDKNEKLLKELEELQKKLQKEELFEKTEKLHQNSKNQKKNLEQLVELTKRFYVEQKAEQLSKKLDDLSKKEEKLSDSNSNNLKEQEKLTKEFEELKKELSDLNKDNKDLKKPLDIPNDKNEQEDIQNDLENSEKDLQNNDSKKASSKQKSAASKMKQMSQKMKSSMESGESMQMNEDIKALRQILDNLLTFSFEQEKLIKPTKESELRSLQLNSLIKRQQELKNQFVHIDDSIFSIALRNPMISEFVLNETGEIHYNLNKTLENLSENFTSKGASFQQYTLTSANKLAEFLSNTKSNISMQMQAQGQGKGNPKPGQGQGKQLSDIIKKQDGLTQKMKDGIKEGEEKGKSPKPGQKEGEGSEGNSGKVLDILKEQQQLRDALAKELERQGVEGNKLINDMKAIEKQLISKGFKNETLQKMLNLKHELLKLETALQEQGEDQKRKSNTNNNQFSNNASALPKELQDYIKSIEILNRQSLPLQKSFESRIQEYFKKQ